MRNVKVDRNGDGTNDGNNGSSGVQGTVYSVLISGGQFHDIDGLEVYGADSGTMARFYQLDGTSRVRNVYAHDGFGVVAGASDDVIQGIWISECTDGIFENLRVERLGYKEEVDDPITVDYCRGIPINGSRSVTLNFPAVDTSLVGIDMTGNANGGNWDMTIFAGRMRNCKSWGIKLANLQKRAKIIDCRSANCDSAGFVDASSWDEDVGDGERNEFIRCQAVDCGGATGTTAGFVRLAGAARPYATPTWFIDCVASDRRATPLMPYGFYNETDAENDGRSRLVGNNQSFGHTTAASIGFPRFEATEMSVGSQPLNANTDTVLSGSVINVPQSDLKVGSAYCMEAELEKTPAGAGQAAIKIRLGTTGTTEDDVIGTITLPNQTAAADTGTLRIKVVMRAVGAAASYTASLALIHEGGTTGLANINPVVRRTSAGSIDATATNLKLSISINVGNLATWTVFTCGATWVHPN
jgi:hypothetical protein